MSALPDHAWFDRPDNDSGEPGLRFECTCCGNCCSGPEGYVLFTPAEAEAMARRLGVSIEDFYREFTRETSEGLSLTEKPSHVGADCVFLDRDSVPGKAVCGVYEDRPTQCRTWPFWNSVARTPQSWRAASRDCPGINRGRLYSPAEIRVSAARADR